MKKILLAGLFLLSLTMVQAQKSTKSCASKSSSCCASKSATKTSANAETATAVLSAMEAAEKDENIQVKTNKETGAVKYYKKTVEGETGTVSLSEVTYDHEKGVFLNLSPKGAKASGKACCAGGGDKKACCSDGKASKASKTNKAVGVGMNSANDSAKRPVVKQIQ